MGFERAESPSQVKGSALVGLGKAQQPEGERAQSQTREPWQERDSGIAEMSASPCKKAADAHPKGFPAALGEPSEQKARWKEAHNPGCVRNTLP